MTRIISSSMFVVFAAICHISNAVPNVRIKRDDSLAIVSDPVELNPVEVSENMVIDDLDRDKRSHDAGFGTKNAIIGYVFSGSNAISSASRPITKAPPTTTTTDDTPNFDRNKVSLDIPDELFGSSFSTVTNVSKIFGDLIMNSARRYSQFMQFFKPILGKTLTIKGLYAPPKTTTEANDI